MLRKYTLRITQWTLILLSGCSNGHLDQHSDPTQLPTAQMFLGSANDAPPALNQFTVLSRRSLDADGPDEGKSAYELIREFGGNKPIESPDLYAENHPDVAHIQEAWDAQVGNHFVFSIHRDIDRDRNRLELTDRQRNEIKTYAGSEDAVKGYAGEHMVFHWRFKVDESLQVSRNFSHFFQLKAVGGDDGQPILTLSGAKRRVGDVMEIRHYAEESQILGQTPWHEVTGHWLEAYVIAEFSEQGYLHMRLTRVNDGAVIFDINEPGLDLWRGETAGDFVRPKWGIYRSLKDVDNLRAEEDQVAFANFSVLKVRPR